MIKNEILTVIDILCRNNYHINVFTTAGQGDAETIVLNHAADNDLIICCGGDGTFNEIVSGCMKLPSEVKMPQIGYIPSGTTNDMAATLNLSGDIKSAAYDIVNGTPYKIDVGSFNDDSYFTYVTSFGAFSKTSYTTPQHLKNTLGHFAYVIEGIREMYNIRPYSLSVKCDKCEIEGDFIFGSVTNATSIGGIIKLKNPHIDLSDGMFEVVLIRQPQNPIELNSLIFNISSQNFKNDKNILFVRTSDINFTVNEPIPWTIDGEFAGDYDSVQIKNLLKAITILKADN
jgi:lipid kinase, YegS/Rv2252/BmrU family